MHKKYDLIVENIEWDPYLHHLFSSSVKSRNCKWASKTSASFLFNPILMFRLMKQEFSNAQKLSTIFINIFDYSEGKHTQHKSSNARNNFLRITKNFFWRLWSKSLLFDSIVLLNKNKFYGKNKLPFMVYWNKTCTQILLKNKKYI